MEIRDGMGFLHIQLGTSNPFGVPCRFALRRGWKGAIRIHDITVYPYTAANPRT